MAEITIIGGINIDIEGCPFGSLKAEDSNPGKISLAYGGVGRNIAENAARLGGDTAMVSVIGDDQMGRGAKAQLAELGVDVSCVTELQGRSSSMYLSILDEKHDMAMAISDMSIMDELTPAKLADCAAFLRSSGIVALDANLDEDFLTYACDLLDGVPLFFDPVSASKAARAKNLIGRFYSMKPNVMEAEVLSGLRVETEADLARVGDWFLSQGLEQLFITLNKDGVYYKSKEKEGILRPRGDLRLVSATGAGDSFSAAILLGCVRGLDIEEIARMGMAAASIAMESEQAVNSNINMRELKRRMREDV